MRSLHLRLLLGAALASASLTMAGAEPKADVASVAKRQQAVELAQRLAKRETPPPLAPDLVQPFNPVAFGQPDPEEIRALAAARATSSAAPAKPATDSDLLKLISSRVMPSGTLILGDESMLIFGKKRLRVGDHLTVTYDGRDYDLELIGVTRTSFSLRLNHDEITRPLKSGKAQ